MLFGLTSDKVVMGGRTPEGWQHNVVRDLIAQVRAVHHENPAGMPLTLGSLLQVGLMRGIHAAQVANLSGQDMSGFTFTQGDLDALRRSALNPGLMINLKGANITDTVFHPASTFNGVLIDECTIDHSDMRGLKFVGLSGEQANLTFKDVDISGMQVVGAKADSPARNVILDVADVKAEGMNIAGSGLLRLHAERSDLNDLNASGARGLRLEVASVSLIGAHFDSVTFAPGSAARDTDLRGASFKGTDIGELDLTGSRIDPRNLYGAYLKGQEITADNVHRVMADKGLLPGMESEVPNLPLTATDALIAQLCGARDKGKDNVKEACIAKEAKKQASLDVFRKPEGPDTGLSV